MKADIVQSVLAGASLEEAARHACVTLDTLRAAQRADPAFAAELARALDFARDPAAVKARQARIGGYWRAQRQARRREIQRRIRVTLAELGLLRPELN